ncbi:hypothetical protein Mapa_009708 [Marchantia paleacea]|nr:hypothetical protein Mapa_009708 [Marchantia paleacea]
MAEQTATGTAEKGGERFSYTDGSIHPLIRPQPKPLKHGLSFFLRVLTLGASLAALIVCVTNKQDVVQPFFDGPFGFEITADFKYMSAFVWFAIATAIVFGYSLLAIIAEACILSKSTHSTYLLWVTFLSDLTMMSILMSACAAALTIELLGQRGNSHAQWGAFCHEFDSFCDHVTGALVAGAVAFAGLAELCILDAYHLSTQYTRY